MARRIDTRRVQKQSSRLEWALTKVGQHWQWVALGLCVLILFLVWLTA